MKCSTYPWQVELGLVRSPPEQMLSSLTLNSRKCDKVVVVNAESCIRKYLWIPAVNVVDCFPGINYDVSCNMLKYYNNHI